MDYDEDLYDYLMDEYRDESYSGDSAYYFLSYPPERYPSQHDTREEDRGER